MSDLQPTLPPLALPQPIPPAANFWTRFFAIAIDVAALTLLFSYIVQIAHGPLYPYRWACYLLSFFAVCAYFVIGSSRWTNGQTLGKRLLGIRVISLQTLPNHSSAQLQKNSLSAESASPQYQPYLNWRQALLRGAMIQWVIFAYLFLPRFLIFFGLGQIAQLLFFIPGIILPGVSAFTVLLPIVLGYLGIAYAASTSVFCGLVPQKQCFHDLLAGTAVVRVGREAEAIEQNAAGNEMDPPKIRAAIWPSAILAVIVFSLFAFTLVKAAPQIPKEIAPIQQASAKINSPAFRLAGLLGPSEDLHHRYLDNRKRYDQALEEAKKNPNPNRAMPELTSETLQYVNDGRRFIFSFECRQDFTSQTLMADPRTAELLEKLPALADKLSKRYYKSPEGDPAPYDTIQADFLEVFPLHLYSKINGVWRVAFPKGERPHTVTKPVRHGSKKDRDSSLPTN